VADTQYKRADAQLGGQESIRLGPIELVVLQGTPFCNLNCSYCYLSEDSRRDKRTISLASVRAVLEKILRSPYLGDKLEVSWHSGEPLVLKPDYYDGAISDALALKDELGLGDLQLVFDIQTNGTLINQRWCDLFKRYQDVLTVGVSVDGPAFLHDAYRQDWAGRGTHERVSRGIKMLCDNGIPFNLIGVVSPRTLDYPDEFFDYFCAFRDHITEFRFNFLDETMSAHDKLAYGKSDRQRYYDFLRALLTRAKRAETEGRPFRINNFVYFYEKLFAARENRQVHTARAMSHPYKTINVDIDGNVSTFYAGLSLDEHEDVYGDGRGLIIGNIFEQSLEEMAGSEKLWQAVTDFETSHRACEKACEYFGLCSGGYNLIKHKNFGTFEATETPECFIHVKTFVDAILDDIDEHIGSAST